MGTGHQHIPLAPSSKNSELRLWWAIGVNMLLTVVQVVVG